MRESLFDDDIILVGGNNLQDAPNTPGQNRRTAFTPSGLWVGECTVTAKKGPSQWHHHADSDSILCMLAGTIWVNWEETGEKSFIMGPGDNAFFWRGVIHRSHIIDGEED